MTFTTITFLVFIILFFSIYWILARGNRNWRNAFMILGGYLFYGWWDWRFLLLLVFSSTIDFCSGLLIDGAKTKSGKKTFLWLSLGVNICLLGFFKYCDFFITSANDLIRLFGYEGSLKTLEIILPVGLSFYTFQSMSYALDVYKGKLTPTRNILDFFAFVSFFPQLVSGPIERAVHMLPQFASAKKFDYTQAVSGLRMIIWGLFKKMVIADTFAVIANSYFGNPGDFDTLSAWIGVFAFTIQIYCDFSGYSDIALGTARLLGFELMMNFRTPYFAKTFTEFWQRWHISLSTWFRDYVFIPLGGNKKGMSRYIINIMITFLLSGFWHGPKYNFIIWGFLHGCMLVVEKLVKQGSPNYKGSLPLVFLMVMLFWIPFRAVDLETTWVAIQSLSTWNNNWKHFIYPANVHNLYFLPVFVLFIGAEAWINKKSFSEKIILVPRYARWTIYYALIASILLFGDFKNAPSFIYFQF
jgi:alginate O-acetyltransferase complex protein AlgI